MSLPGRCCRAVARGFTEGTVRTSQTDAAHCANSDPWPTWEAIAGT